MFTPLAFVLAAVLATFSALSYAELSSRYPQSAGAALYVNKAFGSINLSRFAGILIFFSGLISAGVLANGFAGYLGVFVDIPLWI
ncbi:MAG: hypothetical protein H6765_00055 [Candidatus Peribacteria bacterium]|nr:MAG: hypothetical protein H6765_00055 [Candidatus Peribacteria bacterium]